MTEQPADGLMPFHAMEILKRAKVIEATGRSVCHLEVGEPGAPPAPRVIEAVGKALPLAQGYTNAKGLPELREGLANYYATLHSVVVEPESILCTMGSSAGFIIAFHTAFRPGARIAITRPGYPAYVNTLIGLGFGIAEIPLDPANDWKLTGADIAAAYADAPFDGLLFASPANPTGAAVDRAGLADIVATCKRLGVRLISDEIYHGLDYRGPSVSALELTRDAIVINSFSKYYCMTGWRIGWLVVPQRLSRVIERLAQSLYISAPYLSQVAAIAAFDSTEELEVVKAGYAANRALLLEELPRLGITEMHPVDGAFYIYADIARFTNDSLDFCRRMLDEAGIATTPGLDFDATEGAHHMRLSFAGSPGDCREAIRRLGGWLR